MFPGNNSVNLVAMFILLSYGTFRKYLSSYIINLFILNNIYCIADPLSVKVNRCTFKEQGSEGSVVVSNLSA